MSKVLEFTADYESQLMQDTFMRAVSNELAEVHKLHCSVFSVRQPIFSLLSVGRRRADSELEFGVPDNKFGVPENTSERCNYADT